MSRWLWAESFAREERKKREEQKTKPLYEEPELKQVLSVGYYLK